MVRLPNGAESLSVGELKKALEGIDDNLPVEVFFRGTVPTGNPDGAYVDAAKEAKATSISNHSFDLDVTRFFWY